MEITGWDLVIYTFEQPRVVFARVLATVLERSPGTLVEDIGGDSGVVAVAGSSLTADQLPVGPGVLLFLRDESMARHMEDHGYVPMPDGEGPFALHARVRRAVEFECAGLDELKVTDQPPSVVMPPDPYQAWICSPLVYEITAVTPGDPETQLFSSWVLDIAKRACIGSA